jgi:hypothetical protein
VIDAPEEPGVWGFDGLRAEAVRGLTEETAEARNRPAGRKASGKRRSDTNQIFARPWRMLLAARAEAKFWTPYKLCSAHVRFCSGGQPQRKILHFIRLSTMP